MMRNITKKIRMKVGGEEMEFRLTKLDAFSGARLLKMLANEKAENLQEMLLCLPDAEQEQMMRTCLRAAEAMLPAGPVRVLEDGNWSIPELEYDAWSCMKLTMEVVSWTLEGFFPESPGDTPPGAQVTSRPKPPTSTK